MARAVLVSVPPRRGSRNMLAREKDVLSAFPAGAEKQEEAYHAVKA
jgi:hypothetical protein